MIPIYTNSELVGEERERLFRRSQSDVEAIYEDVKFWIEKVKNEGDTAILEYIQKFDNPDFQLNQLRVSPRDIETAYEKVEPEVVSIIQKQISISRAFHEAQAKRIFAESSWEIETVPGVRTGAKKTSLQSAGLYVPAGKAPLPTVAQILTVAAKCARVPRACVFFPPTANNYEIIVAANEAGADEIYRVGGIAAIAAMAYGTDTIMPVEKIAGPGSPWVQAAKLQVFGQVGIDMLSGPSEALIMADETADPNFVASDVLARIEHGADSACPVVTTSRDLAESILENMKRQFQDRKRKEFILGASKNGYNSIVLVDSLEEMISFANDYAAEHLHIQTKDSEIVSESITNAGSIFIGPYAPVPIGDYASGTNHCLPTSRAVKFSSPVGVETFVKTHEYQVLSKEGLRSLQPIIQTVADIEGLDGHRYAVDVRLSD